MNERVLKKEALKKFIYANSCKVKEVLLEFAHWYNQVSHMEPEKFKGKSDKEFINIFIEETMGQI